MNLYLFNIKTIFKKVSTFSLGLLFILSIFNCSNNEGENKVNNNKDLNTGGEEDNILGKKLKDKKENIKAKLDSNYKILNSRIKELEDKKDKKITENKELVEFYKNKYNLAIQNMNFDLAYNFMQKYQKIEINSLTEEEKLSYSLNKLQGGLSLEDTHILEKRSFFETKLKLSKKDKKSTLKEKAKFLEKEGYLIEAANLYENEPLIKSETIAKNLRLDHIKNLEEKNKSIQERINSTKENIKALKNNKKDNEQKKKYINDLKQFNIQLISNFIKIGEYYKKINDRASSKQAYINVQKLIDKNKIEDDILNGVVYKELDEKAKSEQYFNKEIQTLKNKIINTKSEQHLQLLFKMFQICKKYANNLNSNNDYIKESIKQILDKIKKEKNDGSIDENKYLELLFIIISQDFKLYLSKEQQDDINNELKESIKQILDKIKKDTNDGSIDEDAYLMSKIKYLEFISKGLTVYLSKEQQDDINNKIKEIYKDLIRFYDKEINNCEKALSKAKEEISKIKKDTKDKENKINKIADLKSKKIDLLYEIAIIYKDHLNNYKKASIELEKIYSEISNNDKYPLNFKNSIYNTLNEVYKKLK